MMGVSGCGKTTIGALVAAALDTPFVDGDSLHPVDNIAKMASGWGSEMDRFSVDLTAAPLNLDEDAVAWVDGTIESMSLEEKIRQLFINHNPLPAPHCRTQPAGPGEAIM
ncbi:hypothetical protein IV500_17835 [Paeniglutamicibacter antarcticus]|uniref:gluconokinase n=1 Tax=Arthrobacter terrae TaxID=2935737 RepID=A0A931CS41_9MICC|nr:hypothetical protein [Arthrobacter terrae]